jgi:hypothetical protein
MDDPFEALRPLLPLTVSHDGYDLVANTGASLIPPNFSPRKARNYALAHAANHYDELVAALRNLFDCVEADEDSSSFLQASINARAILAKCGG